MATVNWPKYIYIYIYAFSRRFYPKRLTNAFRLYIFISTCVPWESNPQPFAQLTQCSTTEQQCNPPPPILSESMATVNYLVANILQNIYFFVDGSHWLPLNAKKYHGSQWLPSTIWLPTFFKVSFFVLTVAIDFPRMEKKYHGSQWLPSTIWLPTFFKVSFFVLMVAIDFPCMEINAMEVNGYHQHKKIYFEECW